MAGPVPASSSQPTDGRCTISDTRLCLPSPTPMTHNRDGVVLQEHQEALLSQLLKYSLLQAYSVPVQPAGTWVVEESLWATARSLCPVSHT